MTMTGRGSCGGTKVDPFAVDRPAEIRVADGRIVNEIDLAAEQLLQVKEEVEKAVERSNAFPTVKLLNSTRKSKSLRAGSKSSRTGRAEDIEPGNVVLSTQGQQLRSMFFD